MRNFNLLSRFENWMEGLSSRIRPVSVSYPGSQSLALVTERQPRDERLKTERRVRSLVASRGTKVTHMAFMLLFLLGSLNVWGTELFSDNFSNVGTGQSTTVSSRTGWGTFTNCYCQYNTGIRMGTGSKTGSITKTAITSLEGTKTLTVTFYLAKYNTDGGKMNITIGGAGTASTTQFTPYGNAEVTSTTSAASWDNNYKCTFTITGATKATTITFATSSKRLILGPVSINYDDGGSPQPSALSVPTGMSSGTPTMTGTTLSWNAVDHADGYALTIGTNDPITSGFTTNNGVVSYTLSNLTADTEYTWKVKATTTDTEHYSNSADCAEQNFTTADDPSLLKLTFPLNSNPGEWPTTNSTTTTNYTYTLNDVNYTFALNNVKCNSGYLMMTAIAKLGLPAIKDYKLVKVVASNTSGCSTATEVEITGDEEGTVAVTGGAKQTWSTQGSTYTYDLTGSAYNKMYYMRSVKSSKNTQVTQLKLTYAPKPAVSSIAIKTAPTKTTYTANENFDPSGLVITVNYEGGSSEDVTYSNATASDFSFTPTTSTALNADYTSVTVTYGTKTANQAITVNRIATSLAWSAASYAANIGSSYSFPTLTKTPAALEGVTFTSSNTAVVETISDAGVPTVKGTGSTTITAAFAQTNVYAAATPATYTLTINEASSPTLEVDPTSVAFDVTAVGDNRTETVALAGENLAANATYEITGDDKAMFSIVSPTFPLTPDEGDLLEDITIKYAPTAAAASHTATLTITSGVASATVALSGSAKNRRTVAWYKGDAEELTAQERGSATTSVLDGDAVTAIPAAPASCDDAISFMGWTDAPYAKNDAAPANLYTDVEDFPAISGSNATYYAVWAKGGTKSDELTLSTTGVSGTSYTEWSGKTVTSSAVYAGNSAGGNESIQLRSNNNNSGVVTTASGGKATKVIIEWLSETQTGRTLNVYGKNSAYTAASSLYNEDTQGTLLGTIVKGTSTELTIDGDYAYIGVRSASGAMYLTSLTIQWSNISDYTTTCAAPVEIADPTFSLEGGTYNDDQTLTISKTTPATTIYYTDDNSDPKNSATKKTYSSALTINQDVTIKAIATDGNDNWSEVVSKTYAINYSTSIAAFIEKAQASARALKLNAAQNCIITGIREYNSKYDIYMQDASNKGIIVYGLTTLPEGAAEGKRIEGAISGTYALTNGQHRITGANFTNATFNAAEALTPADITAVDADAYAANPIMLVKLSGVYYNTGSYFTSEAEGEGTSNYVYDSFKKFDGKTMPANTVACDITGILINYNGSTPELLPLSLTTSATAVLPAISPVGGADAENAVEVTYMSTVSVPMVENEEVYISVNNAEPALLAEDASVQIEGDVKLVVSAKRDFYADNSVTYYYKPSAYPKQIAVTSEHGDVVVKVGDNTVSTALPESNVTFTVAEAAHFHIASVAVNYEGGSLTPALSEGKYSFTMPDKDVTIDLTYTEDTHYTITYAAGGATSGSAPAGALTWQYAGEDVELLANAYVWDEDHNFTGWKVTYGETELDKAVGQSFEMPAANVTITAQWVEKQYCALTLKVNGADYLVKNIEQTIEQTISDLAGYENPANQNGYEFVGWAENPETEDVEEAIATIESYTPEAGEASKTLYAVFSRVDVGAEKTDVLTADDLAATSTTYTDFSNVSKTSNAVYAGNSAKAEAGSIQLRSKNSNSGIVTTSTGGILKSVTINVESGSATIDVYGSNTAYSAASDLYGSAATQGTKIGSTSTTNTINAVADYKYVGIRSNSGAIYLSSVEITWQPKTTYYTTAPSAVYAVSYALGGGAWQEDEGCDGANVKAGQTFDICESVPVREHYKFNGWTVGGNAVSGTITINGATAITANWIAKVENNITYNAGSGSGSDAVVGTNEEGAEIVLPSAADKSFSKSGFDFVGWLYNGNLYKAGTTFEMPASAVTFVAQWKKQNITKMTLVTDASQLVDGSKVVLANQTASTVAGESAQESETYLTKVDGTFNEDKSILTNLGDGIELTLVQVTGGWALEYNGKYLKPYSTNKVAWDAAPTVWTISISSNNAVIETPGNSGSALRYNKNSGSERFSAYSSKNSCEPIQLYASVTAITDDASISELGYVEGDVIVVNSGTELTMDEPSSPANITVKEGATVTVSAETHANNITVENGATIEVGATTAANNLVIQTTSGSTENQGKSGQLTGSVMPVVSGDLFIEIKLCEGAMDAEASRKWYCISAPFNVNMNGGFFWGDGTQMVLNTDFQLFEWDGDRRATGISGWKRVSGVMKAGIAYFIGFDDERSNQNIIKLKATNKTISNKSSINAPEHSSSVDDKYANWNGLANPNFRHIALNKDVQAFDHNIQAYTTYGTGDYNFVVGTPFFIKETGDITIEAADNSSFRAPKREVEQLSYCVRIVREGKAGFDNQMYVRASEEASASYEEGHDLVTMNAETSNYGALLWTVNYGGKRLAIEEAPLVNDKASYALSLYAPADGAYRIETPTVREDASLYLTYEGNIIWDLSAGAYELELNKGATEGYGLMLVRKAPQVTTGVENVQGDKIQCTKVILNDHVYILRDAQLYDVTGKAVK